MRKPTPPVSVLSLLTRVLALLALVVTIHQIASAQALATPAQLRVDISDGNSNQLFVSWKTVTGADHYNLQRSTQNSGWSTVTTCLSHGSTNTPFEVEVCRDSNVQVTNPPTYYNYQVAACDHSNVCSAYTSPVPPNAPINCNCTQGSESSQIPPMVSGGNNMIAPQRIALTTSNVTPDALYMPAADEYAAYHNPNYGIPLQNKLVIQLPGSGSTCSYSHFMYTAQNLGFDTICVNYSNNTQQETICQGDPQCFYSITQAKFDATGPCIHPEVTFGHCGYDPALQGPYFCFFVDSVSHRVITMLQYLSNPANGYTAGANWAQYLTSGGTVPNWSKIIVGGFSQGGDMATYIAGLENTNGTPILRAINLSAPPQATLVQIDNVNTQMTAASYFAGPPPWFSSTTIRSVFGLVSANDDHYKSAKGTINPTSVFQAVWTAMGFTAAYNDAEWDLNCTHSMNIQCHVQTLQGLNCLGTPSNNLVNFAAVKQGGDGHDDTLEIWNQDLYEFMLLDN
jgi:hypothetical protein